VVIKVLIALGIGASPFLFAVLFIVVFVCPNVLVCGVLIALLKHPVGFLLSYKQYAVFQMRRIPAPLCSVERGCCSDAFLISYVAVPLTLDEDGQTPWALAEAKTTWALGLTRI
jgi:hypothetical protein